MLGLVEICEINNETKTIIIFNMLNYQYSETRW